MNSCYSFNKKLIAVGIIIIIGASLRFYKINLRSLWYDEATNISIVEHPYLLGELLHSRDAKKIAYTFLLKTWICFFGDSGFSARSLSVGLAALSIIFFYFLVSRLIMEKAALISMFFLALSPFHIYYSQQISEYSLLFLCSIISLFIFLKLYRTQNKRVYFYYFFINLILCYTHIFGLYLVFIYNFCLLLFDRRLFFDKKWIISQLAVFIGAGFLFIFIQDRVSIEVDWIKPPVISILGDTFKAFTYGGERLAQGGEGWAFSSRRFWFARGLMVIAGILLLKGFFSCKNICFSQDSSIREEKRLFLMKNINLFFAILIIIPIIVSFVFSIFVFPVYVVRYFMIIFPAYLILLGVGAASIRRVRIKIIVLVLMAMMNSQALWIYFHPEKIDSWREIAGHVKENAAPGDMFIFTPLKQIVPFEYYFSGNPRKSFLTMDILGKKENDEWRSVFYHHDYLYAGVKLKNMPYEMMNNGLFQSAAIQAGRVFLIASPYWPGIDGCDGAVKDYLVHEGYQEIKSLFYPYPGVEVSVYEKYSRKIEQRL